MSEETRTAKKQTKKEKSYKKVEGRMEEKNKCFTLFIINAIYRLWPYILQLVCAGAQNVWRAKKKDDNDDDGERKGILLMTIKLCMQYIETF